MLDLLARDFGDVDVSAMCDSELRESYLAARRMADRLEASAARFLAALHGRGIPAGDGASSTSVWVQWQTGQRVSEAKASLQAGQVCEFLPLTAKAWHAGEISASAARTICRGVRPKHEDVYAQSEERLVGCAVTRNFSDLDGLIRHYQTRADALDDIQPRDKNGLHLSHVGNRWIINGDLDERCGSTASEAILAATDKPTADDTRSSKQRRADAFHTVCRFFLDHAELPVKGGERPHLTIDVSWEVIAEYADALLATRPTSIAFSPADIRQMLCDARVARIVYGPDSVPLDVGRASYEPSAGLRRAVIARDKHCRHPGCHRRASWSQIHHFDPWELGGHTKLDNLLLLCDYHHHLIHRPGWKSTFDGHTYTVTNPDGRLLGSTENETRHGSRSAARPSLRP